MSTGVHANDFISLVPASVDCYFSMLNLVFVILKALDSTLSPICLPLQLQREHAAPGCHFQAEISVLLPL